MIEFEIDGHEFRYKAMPAMQQFHLARKIAPLVPALMPMFQKVMEDEKAGKSVTDELGALGKLMQPFTDGLAGMDDAQAESIFNACLSTIFVKFSGNWIMFWNVTAKVAMVEELNDIGLLLKLVVKVVTLSLGPFISGLLTKGSEGKPAQ